MTTDNLQDPRDNEIDWDTTDEDTDEEEIDSIRMKWCADGSHTLDEVIEKLKNQIAFIQELKEQGYELIQPMMDDWGHIKKQRNVECHEVSSDQ